MRILLTGSEGFVGRCFQAEIPCIPLVDAEGRTIDIRNFSAISSFIAQADFDAVLHLAGKSFVMDSFKNPREIFEVNLMGSLNLLMALQEGGFRGRFLYVGSGEEYGLVREGQLPITEEQLLKPRSPYAASKIAAEAFCYQMSLNAEFEILMARPFNHIGPGQSERFVIAGLAKQLVQIKLGLQDPKIFVGNIEVTRDFTDVRDIVRAYKLLLEKGSSGEVYNVCSGREYRIRDLLEKMLEIAGVNVEIAVDPVRLRAAEQKRALGSFQKLNRATGWSPSIPIEKSLGDILSDWKARLA